MDIWESCVPKLYSHQPLTDALGQLLCKESATTRPKHEGRTVSFLFTKWRFLWLCLLIPAFLFAGITGLVSQR